MTYILMWIFLSALIYLTGRYMLPPGTPQVTLIILSFGIAGALVANELRRPLPREYLRKKSLYPKIPNTYLSDCPISESVVFGKDYHTNKFVVAEQGHHTLICGSTGSGKTATCLIPSIQSCKTGSKQIVDIKSRELAYKTANIKDKRTIIIDLNLKEPYVWGWDIFYKLKKDGTDTEQETLSVIQEVASVIVPKAKSGDGFWAEAARNEFIGLSLFEYCYHQQYEFIDIINTLLNIPLREHMETALNTVPKSSMVASYLTSLASTGDNTLFSVDLTLNQCLFQFVSDDSIYFFRDNPKRANPQMLNKEGITQYLCVSEEKLDTGFDKMINIVMKQTLSEIQSRTTSGFYPQTMLYWDEWQRLTESCEELRAVTSSFLKTGRSKHASVVLCCQNLDNFKKEQIFDIISNIHYFYILSSNNSNSLTSEVVCKMAGTYYEKTKSFSEGKGGSTSTSFQEKQILKPEDLNRLGDDGVLLISNFGYVRTNKEATAYYKTEPFQSKYKEVVTRNEKIMASV